jgi:putative transposase
MKKKQFTTEQIIGILREGNAGGNISAVCRKHGVSSSTFCAWKMRYGDMNAPDAKRLKELEAENAKLKRLLADSALDNAALKDLLGRKW